MIVTSALLGTVGKVALVADHDRRRQTAVVRQPLKGGFRLQQADIGIYFRWGVFSFVNMENIAPKLQLPTRIYKKNR